MRVTAAPGAPPILKQGVVMLPRAKAGARAAGDSERRRPEDPPGSKPTRATGGPYERRISRVFRKASRAAALRDFRFHYLRHHGATMALNKGFTAPIVMAWAAGRPSG